MKKILIIAGLVYGVGVVCAFVTAPTNATASNTARAAFLWPLAILNL